MYTRCIKCDTVYQISAEQLRSGRGEAICTGCTIIFGALENLGETPEEAAEDHSSCILELPELGANATVSTANEASDKSKPQKTDSHRPAEPPPSPTVEQEPQIKPFDPDVLLSMGAKEQEKDEAEARARLYRILATAALAVLLLVQLFVYKKDELAQNPHFRPWLESFCGMVGCTLPPFSNLAEIKVVDRALYPTKNSVDGYQFHLVIVNQAPYSQPYPLLKITFSSLDGTPIASRIFKPDEYLPPEHPPLMPSHQLIFVDLDLAAPSRPVGGFSFEFLE